MSNSLNEELYHAYVAAGATSINIGEAEKQALVLQGAADGTWDTFLRAQGLSGSVNDMMHAYLVGRGYSGSLNDMLYAAAVAHDLFAPAVATFDPETLPWTSGRYRRWWHSAEATFMNGASAAGVGDPVSKVISQASSDTFDQDYLLGSSPTLEEDSVGKFLDMKSSTYMSADFPGGGSITPKTTGITFFARYFPGYGSDLGAISYLCMQDDGPLEHAARLWAISTGPGTFSIHLLVYGSGGSYTQSPDLYSYLVGGGQTLGYTLKPDAGGTCEVKVYTDSSTPFHTGTVTSSGSMTRVREWKEQPICASFFAAQDFSSNVDDILAFLTNGSGA